MIIAYLPIDERPCNVDVVKRIADSANDISLVLPELSLLGKKKVPGNTERLWEWLNEIVYDVDAIILSIDMLMFGGLLPSRLHCMSYKQGEQWLERLNKFGAAHPETPIYASNMIMRTPKYNSSDEEPDYYEKWGSDLFSRSYLLDKQKRNTLSDTEHEQLLEIESRLPVKWIEDYEARRKFNLYINKGILRLVSEGVITFLSIPLDDSAEYGYSAIDQAQIVNERNKMGLYEKVQIYPGADEAGATLLTRAYNKFKGVHPTIYPFWSSTLGPQLIPMYEDRPFAESLKAHVLASGCQLTSSLEKADLVLAYNTPGRVMQESWEQVSKDITYSSFRNIQFFVEQIHSCVLNGKNVIIADSAFANGGDYELIKLLDEKHILDRVISYKGWNTNCNTLGSTICQGVISLNSKVNKIQENLLYHLIDDYFYQAEVRMEMTSDFLPNYNLTYFDLKELEEIVNKERNNRLLNRYHEVINNSFKDKKLKHIQTFSPWNRMFECGLNLEFEE